MKNNLSDKLYEIFSDFYVVKGGKYQSG